MAEKDNLVYEKCPNCQSCTGGHRGLVKWCTFCGAKLTGDEYVFDRGRDANNQKRKEEEKRNENPPQHDNTAQSVSYSYSGSSGDDARSGGSCHDSSSGSHGSDSGGACGGDSGGGY